MLKLTFINRICKIDTKYDPLEVFFLDRMNRVIKICLVKVIGDLIQMIKNKMEI